MSNSLITLSAQSTDRKFIPSITLFAAGNIAQVKRQFEVSLDLGQTSVELIHLPAWLDRESLSVEAVTQEDDEWVDVAILDYSFFQSDDDSQEGSSQLLKDLYELRDRHSTVLDTLNSEEQILKSYGDKINCGSISPEQLTQFLRRFGNRMVEISSERRKINAEIEVTNRKIAKEERAGDHGKGGQPRNLGVCTKLSIRQNEEMRPGNNKVDVRFIVTYTVNGASWSPIYEVRAKDSDKKQGLVDVEINYRSLIVNSTGEPWVKSRLYLSTSSPSRNARVPILKPYRLSFPAPPGAPSPTPTVEPRMAMLRMAPKMLMSASVQEGALDEIVDGNRAMMRGAGVEGGGLTTILKVEGTVDVACDGEEHTLTIAQLQLSGSMRHVTVPTANAAAFLEVKMTNHTPYPLLSGVTRTYLDGNYVSKGRLGNVNSLEEFKISLGVDPSITVTCSPEERFKKTSGGFISNSTEVTSFARRVNITNNRSNPIDIEVLYNYPVSEDSKIVVRPVPSNTFSSFPMKDNQGNRIDWQEGASGSGSGLVRAVCLIGSGQKRTVTWQWEVEGSGWVVSE